MMGIHSVRTEVRLAGQDERRCFCDGLGSAMEIGADAA
jgi:hypothetical protein